MTDQKTDMTPAYSEVELRRAFDRALADALKGDGTATAAVLEVARKRLHDLDEDRRWAVDRAENEDLKKISTAPSKVTVDRPLPFLDGQPNPAYQAWREQQEAQQKHLPDLPFMASE
jgi:hypothetical protein